MGFGCPRRHADEISLRRWTDEVKVRYTVVSPISSVPHPLLQIWRENRRVTAVKTHTHHDHGPASRSRNLPPGMRFHAPNTIVATPINLSFFIIIGSNCGGILHYDDDDDESKLLPTQSPHTLAMSRSRTTTILQRIQSLFLPIVQVVIVILL